MLLLVLAGGGRPVHPLQHGLNPAVMASLFQRIAILRSVVFSEGHPLAKTLFQGGML